MPWVHQLCPSESPNVTKELKDVFLTWRWMVKCFPFLHNNLPHLSDWGLEILNDNLGALKGGHTRAITIKPEVWVSTQVAWTTLAKEVFQHSGLESYEVKREGMRKTCFPWCEVHHLSLLSEQTSWQEHIISPFLSVGIIPLHVFLVFRQDFLSSCESAFWLLLRFGHTAVSGSRPLWTHIENYIWASTAVFKPASDSFLDSMFRSSQMQPHYNYYF